MSSAKISKNKTEAKKNSDAVLNRIMLIFAVCIGAATFILMNKGGPVERTFVIRLLPWCQITGAVLFIAALVYYFIKRSKGSDESGHVITSSLLLSAAAVLLAILVSYKFLGTSLIIAFLITVMIIAMTRHYYPASFMWLTVFAAIGAALVIAAKSSLAAGGIFTVFAVIGKILAFLWPLCGIILALKIKKNSGIVETKSGDYKMFEKDESALPFVIIGALCVIGALAACLFSSFASWGAAAIVAVYAVLFILVTVKKVK